MGRQKKGEIEVFLSDVYATLLVAPWWLGPPLAGLVYSMFRWFIPGMLAIAGRSDPIAQTATTVFADVSAAIAPFAAGLICLVWLVALTHRGIDRRRVDSQTGLESLRNLSWREFERLLAEAFRREGYLVELGGGHEADGGVDLRLKRGDTLEVVQCKHWKARKVGVKVIRELRGVMAVEGAGRGAVVTSGGFTREAEDFAAAARIRLIDGGALLDLIRSVQHSPRIQKTEDKCEPSPVPAPRLGEAPESLIPPCPTCGGAMVLRIARQGANTGRRFWGCASFPKCRGIVNVKE